MARAGLVGVFALASCHWVIGHSPPAADRGTADRARELALVDLPSADRRGSPDRSRPEAQVIDAPRDQRPPDHRPADLRPPDKPPDKLVPDKLVPDKSPPQEICDNGVDDDGDSKIDCADQKCASQGYACVPIGSVDLAKHAPTAGVSCAGGGSATTYFYTAASTSSYQCTCNPCGIAPPPGCCELSPLACGNNSCTDGVTPPVLPPVACNQLPAGIDRCATGPATPKEGCDCGISSAATMSAGWQYLVTACPVGGLGSGCSPGFLCAAPHGSGVTRCAPFSAACYQTLTTLFKVEQDGRTCDCRCEVGCAGGGYELYCGNTPCTTYNTFLSPDSPCTPIPCGATIGLKAISRAPTATCTPASYGVKGTVTGASPVTYCCPAAL